MFSPRPPTDEIESPKQHTYDERKQQLVAKLAAERDFLNYLGMSPEERRPMFKECAELLALADEMKMDAYLTAYDSHNEDVGLPETEVRARKDARFQKLREAEVEFSKYSKQHDRLLMANEASPAGLETFRTESVTEINRQVVEIYMQTGKNAVSSYPIAWSANHINAIGNVLNADLTSTVEQYGFTMPALLPLTRLVSPRLAGNDPNFTNRRKDAISLYLGNELADRVVEEHVRLIAASAGGAGTGAATIIRPAGVFDSRSREKTFNRLQTERLLSL